MSPHLLQLEYTIWNIATIEFRVFRLTTLVITAFKRLDALYGTWRAPSTLKKGFNLPVTKMTNTDLAALLKAPEILKVCRRPM